MQPVYHRFRVVVGVLVLWLIAALIGTGWSTVIHAQSGLTISGRVWNDVDADSTLDGGESGISGVTVVLYDVTSGTCTSTATDVNGDYQFTGLTGGGRAYRVYEASGESTPVPAVCPPTETTADLPTVAVTLGTILDPSGFTSSTANRIDVTLTTADAGNQNFGDFAAMPFNGCPSDAFLYQKIPTDFYGVSLVTGSYTLLRDDWTFGTNAVGFNLLDSYLYGFATGTDGYITLTDGNYNIVQLKVAGLGAVGSYVGDVSADGYLYLNRGNNQLYIVDVNPQRTTYLTLVATETVSPAPNFADWAFSPIDGMLYGVRANGQLVQVNPVTFSVTVIGNTGITDGGAFGAVYFDVNGFFYASNNGTGKIYRMDLRDAGNLNPKATFFTNGPKSSSNDGARCMFAEVGQLDLGDAPAGYGTLLNDDGPRHILRTGLELGVLIDSEDDGQPNANATGDDINHLDDEDGLVGGFPGLPLGAVTYSVQVAARNALAEDAYLVGFLDWNNDGDFLDPGERSDIVTVSTNGTFAVQWTVPARPTPLATFARFRLSTDRDQAAVPLGPAIDGEVEDYQTPPLYTGNTLTIAKDAAPDDGSDFRFSQDVDDSGDFLLSNGQSEVFTNLPTGTYNIAEIVPAGWRLVDLSCDDPDATVNGAAVTVSVGQGEDVTCTFTNQAFSTLVVIKSTAPTQAAQTFPFTLTGQPDFILGDGDVAQFDRLSPGSYTLQEGIQSVAGWDVGAITCNSQNGLSTYTADLTTGTASIALGGSDRMTCTYANVEQGELLLRKQTVGADGTFNFTSTSLTPDAFALTTNNGAAERTFAGLKPGIYDLTETPQQGWDLTDASCDDGSPLSSITVSPGETVTCTVTNTKRGTIVIKKQTSPEGGTGFGFTDTIALPNEFTLDDGQSRTFDHVRPGTYTVTEDDLTGTNYRLAGITCDDLDSTRNVTDRTAVIDLDAGETVTCIFTNLELNEIAVEKVVTPPGASGTFGFSQDVDASGPFNLNGGQTREFGFVASGVYTVAEDDPTPDFDLTAIDCYDTDTGQTFTGDLATRAVKMKLVAGERIHCGFTNVQRGTVIIDKATTPAGGTGFTFSHDLDASGPFTLDDGEEAVFAHVVPGSYTVTETALPAGWRLDDVKCDDGVSLTPGAPDAPNRRVTINVDPGETVRCTFANEALGTIIIAKRAQGGDGAFRFTSTDLGDFTLTTSSGAAQQSFTNLVPGEYDVRERTQPGWDLTDVTCSDGSDPATIQVAPGETVTCTFTNTKRATLIVAKTAQGGDAEFNFNSPELGGFALSTVGGSAQTDFTNLVPGSFSVTETPQAGWDSVSATCDNGDAPAAVQLDPGETVTCTFTNAKRGAIVVRKVAVGDDATFDFTSPQLGDFDLVTTGGGAEARFDDLVPGAYGVTETPLAGWDLQSATCDDTNSTPGAITLDPGETVTCTFTNWMRGEIIVQKVTSPSGAAQSFDFTVAGGPESVTETFALGDGESRDVTKLRPGAGYSVSEDLPAGWFRGGAACDDGSDPADIELSPGESVTCTFANVQGGNFVVAKVTIPAGGVGFDFTADFAPNPFTLSDGEAARFDGLAPGQAHTVTESDPSVAEFKLIDIECDGAFDGSPEINIDTRSVRFGLQVNGGGGCVFTNQQQGRIIVSKVTIPAGDPQIFPFRLAGNDPKDTQIFSLRDGDPPHDSGPLAPGRYAVSEDLPDDWLQSDVTCSDGSTPDAIDLAPGETVACTFTNTRAAAINVDKVTAPAGESQRFDFTVTGGPDVIDQRFALTDADPPHTVRDLKPGRYVISESQPDGWTLATATCNDGSDPAAVDLEAGASPLCTFTNQRLSRIVVDKVTDPRGSALPFSFVLRGGPDNLRESFLLTDEDAPFDSGLIKAGTYSVTETTPAGWVTNAACTGGSSPDALDLAPGATITCTFTNRGTGRIIINKATVPADDPQPFPMTLAGGPDAIDRSFSLAATDAPYDSGELKAGVYSLTETTLTGWRLDGITCDDGSPANAIDLKPGATVTCSVVNVKDGALIVRKETAPRGLAGLFEFTGAVTGAIGDGQELRVAPLTPGVYTVTEADPGPNFVLTDIRCDDADSDGELISRTAVVNVAPGETVTCTFVNAAAAVILTPSYLVTRVEEGKSIGEGSIACYWITLSLVPDGDVVVDVDPDRQLTDVTVNPARIILHEGNWNNLSLSDRSNFLCVRAVDDQRVDAGPTVCGDRSALMTQASGAPYARQECGGHVAFITHEVNDDATTARGFSRATPWVNATLSRLGRAGDNILEAMVSDDDNAGIILTQSFGVTDLDEDGSPTNMACYWITAAARPASGEIVRVTAQVSTLGPGNISFSPGVAQPTATVQLTEQNWDALGGFSNRLCVYPVDDRVVNAAPDGPFTATRARDLFGGGAMGTVRGDYLEFIEHTVNSTVTTSPYNRAPAFTNNGTDISGAGRPQRIEVLMRDDEVPGLVFTPNQINVLEGDDAVLTVRLRSQPAADVSVTLTAAPTAYAAGRIGGDAVAETTVTENTVTENAVTELTFSPADWNLPQTVTIAVPDNDVADGRRVLSVHAALRSRDPHFDGIALENIVPVQVADNESAGIFVLANAVAVAEGGAAARYAVVLTSRPRAAVMVDVLVDAQVTVDRPQLLFTAANWNQPQWVTVRAVDDSVDDDAAPTAIRHAARSEDSGYQGLVGGTLSVEIADDDMAGVIIDAPQDATLREGARTAYQMRLTSRPVGPVTIWVATDGRTAADPASLTFTPSNWAVAQSVLLTAVDDAVDVPIDARVALVNHVVTGEDPSYTGMELETLQLTVTDNDTAAVRVTPSALRVPRGAPATYTVHLASRPTHDVVVQLMPAGALTVTATCDDHEEAPACVRFTPDTWDTPQPVIVTGVTVGQALVRHIVASSDSRYDRIDAPSLSLTVEVNPLDSRVFLPVVSR